MAKIRSNLGKPIGYYRNGTAYFKRQEKNHTFHKTDAWCIDVNALTTLVTNKVHTIEIEATDTGVFFSVDISTFQAEGTQLTVGFGDQVCLPKKYWRKKHIGTKTPISLGTQLEMQLGN